MNKKLLVVSILAVFMLVAISFASAVSSNTMSDEKRESPLFRIRIRKAIGERLDELKEAIKAKFIGERLFFLSFQWLKNREDQPVSHRLAGAKIPDTVEFYPTCLKWGGWCTMGSNC